MHQHERVPFLLYNYTVCVCACVNCRGLIGINLGCDLWGKRDLHYFLTRIKWRPCGYMNSLLDCNRWAWMCSLGKLSVTSVSSKFWWSQPINRQNGGRGGGLEEGCFLHSLSHSLLPLAKAEAEVLVFRNEIKSSLKHRGVLFVEETIEISFSGGT